MILENTPGGTPDNDRSAPSALDPVCGMTVDPARAAGSAVHEGHTYYFCSTGCLQKFRADPQKFIGSRLAEPAPTPKAGGTG
ncbi:MAG: YHS domain-containing protein, partial [Gemmataceae bacterium]